MSKDVLAMEIGYWPVISLFVDHYRIPVDKNCATRVKTVGP
jgi:hypothetical protein